MGGESHAPSSSVEKQFEDFRLQLEETGNLHDRIWKVVMEIESIARLIHANLLLLHQSRPTLGMEICCYYCILFIYFDQFLWSLSFVWLFEIFWDDFEKNNCFDSLFFGAEVLEKPKAQIAVLRELYSRLAEVLHECPGQYYRWCWFFGSTFFLKLLITKSQAHNHKRSSSYIFTTEINPAQNFTWRSNWTLKL